MKNRQLSVATAMAAIGYLAIGFAALKSPTPLWVNMMFSLAIVLLAIAALGAIHRRTFWLGFAIVGGGYLALVFGPWIDERLGSRLVSTSLIRHFYNGLVYTPKEQYEDVWWSTETGFDTGYIAEIDDGTQPPTYRVTLRDGRTLSIFVSNFRPIDPSSYQVLGHSILCPIIACLGGIVAQQFAARRVGPGHTGIGNATVE